MTVQPLFDHADAVFLRQDRSPAGRFNKPAALPQKDFALSKQATRAGPPAPIRSAPARAHPTPARPPTRPTPHAHPTPPLPRHSHSHPAFLSNRPYLSKSAEYSPLEEGARSHGARGTGSTIRRRRPADARGAGRPVQTGQHPPRPPQELLDVRRRRVLPGSTVRFVFTRERERRFLWEPHWGWDSIRRDSDFLWWWRCLLVVRGGGGACGVEGWDVLGACGYLASDLRGKK